MQNTIEFIPDHSIEKRSKILLLVPVFNEAKNLERVLSKLEKKWEYNILFINDGSSDDSLYFIKDRASSAIVSHKNNLGVGISYFEGIKYAIVQGYDYLLTFDSDLQHDAEFINYFLENAGDADIISGSRYLPGSPVLTETPRFRKMGNEFYSKLLYYFSGLNLTDVWCGMNLFHLKKIDNMILSSSGYSFILELWIKVIHNQLTVKEIPIPRIYFEKDFNRDKSGERLKSDGYDFFKTFFTYMKAYYHVEINQLIDYSLKLLNNGEFDFSKEEFKIIQNVMINI